MKWGFFKKSVPVKKTAEEWRKQFEGEVEQHVNILKETRADGSVEYIVIEDGVVVDFLPNFEEAKVSCDEKRHNWVKFKLYNVILEEEKVY